MTLNHQQKVILIVITVAVLIIGGYALSQSVASDEIVISTQVSSDTQVTFTENNQLVVYVTGAVKTEGVVKLKPASRLIDALTAAGGLKENADLSKINLAAKVKDGQKIEIPFKVSTSPPTLASNANNKSGLINVNRANAKELQKIKGIGKKMSQDIVNYREENGVFSSIDELKKVKGIGDAKLEKIRGSLCVQ